jgi:hypothetical protein
MATSGFCSRDARRAGLCPPLPTLPPVTTKMWKWVGWMSFSTLLLVVFGILTWRNIGEIRDAESAVATIIETPIVSPAGEGEIATARVRFTTQGGTIAEPFVLGVPVDSSVGDTVQVHYLGSDPDDAAVDDPPNRVLGLVLSAIFAVIGAGGLWGFGNERPHPEDEV